MQTLIPTDRATLEKLASNHSPKPLARLRASLADAALRRIREREAADFLAAQREAAERAARRNRWDTLPTLTFPAYSFTPAAERRAA